MKIEFSAIKNVKNIYKHGLSFDMAHDFGFDTAIITQDVRRDYGEVRYIATGYLNIRLHILCFTEIPGGIRVISFRKANAREKKRYEKTTTFRKTAD